MKKEDLLKLRKLNATKTMMNMAKKDVPEIETVRYGNYEEKREKYKIGIYMRCQHAGGLLKTAFFLADRMRKGNDKPTYEIYINNETGEFLTYDTVSNKWREAKIDMLDWPWYTRYSGKWINPEGNKSIKSYLDVKQGGYAGIFEYQVKIRSKELKQRHKRETGPWDMDMERVPPLPKDWDKWAVKVGITENFLFYDYDRKGVKEGYCSWCEKIVPVKNPKNNHTGKCSCCGHEVTYKAKGKAGTFASKSENMYLIQQCDDGFVLRQFIGNRNYKKDRYTDPYNHISEIRRVIYNDRLEPKDYDFILYKNTEMRWVKRGSYSNYYSYYYQYEGKVYGKTIPILNKKVLSKTGLPQMISGLNKIDPEIYLGKLRYQPFLEQLAKAELTTLARDIMKRGNNDIKISNIGELSKNLNIDGNRMNRLRKNNGGYGFLEWLKYEKSHNKNIPDEVIKYFSSENIKSDELGFISKRMSELKISNYLKKQYKISGRKVKELVQTWDDYLHMAKRLKINTDLEIFYKPKDLLKAHNDAVKLSGGAEIAIRAGEIADLFPNVDEICQEIKPKYEYADKKYTVIVPNKIEDIIKEGRILGHCVDSDDRYFERISKRITYTMFLRKADDIDMPYYTLEVQPNGTIRQKRTTGDNQNKDIDDAKRFLEKWQKEISKRLSIEDMNLGRLSSQLRVSEYEKLREQKAKIRNGIFAGELLADVLEADLMEAQIEMEEEAISA